MSNGVLKNWRDYPDGREKYGLYLASREWAVLKEAVRKRSGGTCERCRHNDGEQVHHQTYDRKYNERLEDLVHTCRACHEFLSGKRKQDPIWDSPERVQERNGLVYIGLRVMHPEYGLGEIILIDDSAPERKVHVRFVLAKHNRTDRTFTLDKCPLRTLV